MGREGADASVISRNCYMTIVGGTANVLSVY